MSRINRQVCRNCGATNSLQIDRTTAAGDITCTECGTVQEENPIVSEVQFGESSSGAAMVQGSMVGSDQARATFGGRQNAMESREQTLANGRRKIHRLAVVLKIQPHVADAAGGWFKLALTQNFVQGRRSQNVLAACLYVACRKEKTPHMLIDFSSRLQISVYSLGATFLKMVKALQITNLPLADPSLFIQHFAASLSFGSKTKKITKDACKIAHRMANDWIHEGRRPAGIAGACVMLAARMNNIRRTHAEIVNVAHVAPETLQRRLNEFKKTASGSLSVKEFRQSSGTAPSMPPSYDRNRKLELKLKKQIEEREEALRRYIDLANKKQLVPIEIPDILLTTQEREERELERKKNKETEQTSPQTQTSKETRSEETVTGDSVSETQEFNDDTSTAFPAEPENQPTSNTEATLKTAQPGDDTTETPTERIEPSPGTEDHVDDSPTDQSEPSHGTEDHANDSPTGDTAEKSNNSETNAGEEVNSMEDVQTGGVNSESHEETERDSNSEEASHETQQDLTPKDNTHTEKDDEHFEKSADEESIQNLNEDRDVSEPASATSDLNDEVSADKHAEVSKDNQEKSQHVENTPSGQAEKEDGMDVVEEAPQQEEAVRSPVPNDVSTEAEKSTALKDPLGPNGDVGAEDSNMDDVESPQNNENVHESEPEAEIEIESPKNNEAVHESEAEVEVESSQNNGTSHESEAEIEVGSLQNNETVHESEPEAEIEVESLHNKQASTEPEAEVETEIVTSEKSMAEKDTDPEPEPESGIESDADQDMNGMEDNEPKTESMGSDQSKSDKGYHAEKDNAERDSTRAKSEPPQESAEDRGSDDSDSDEFQDALEENEGHSGSYSATANGSSHLRGDLARQFENEAESGLQEEVEKELKKQLARHITDENVPEDGDDIVLVKESERGRRLRPRLPATTSVPIPAPPESPSVEPEISDSEGEDDFFGSDEVDSDAEELNAFLEEDERRGFSKRPIEQHLFVNEDSEEESADEGAAAAPSPSLFMPEDDEPFEQPPQLRARLAKLDDRSRRRDLRQSRLKESRMSEAPRDPSNDENAGRDFVPEEAPRKRGRPPKKSITANEPIKKGRGRPRKEPKADTTAEVAPRKRGRPRKVPQLDDVVLVTPRGRGRPRKVVNTPSRVKPEPELSDSDHEIEMEDFNSRPIKAETGRHESSEEEYESDVRNSKNHFSDDSDLSGDEYIEEEVSEPEEEFDEQDKIEHENEASDKPDPPPKTKRGRKRKGQKDEIENENEASDKSDPQSKTQRVRKSKAPRRPRKRVQKPMNLPLEEERAIFRRQLKAQKQQDMIKKIQESIERRQEALQRLRERAPKLTQSQISAQIKADKDEALLQSVLISSGVSENELTSELERIINKQKKGLESLQYAAPSENAEASDHREKTEINRPRNLVQNLPSSRDLLQKVRSDVELDSGDDDDEVNNIELEGEALEQKTRIWTGLNYDYIMEQERKRLKEEADILTGNTSGNSKKKRRISKSEILGAGGEEGMGLAEGMESIGVNPATGESSSAAESAKRMLAKKPFSKKINYDTLNDLFAN